MPPKIVLEQHLRPAGLPDELINEIPAAWYQGPGEKNPYFPKPVVEQFVKERRPKPVDRESCAVEGLKDMDFTANNDLAVVVREFFEWMKPRLEAALPEKAAPPSTFSAEQVAARLRLHVQTVMRWCREGEMEATKVGKKWLIPKASVDAYERKCRLRNGGVRK